MDHAVILHWIGGSPHVVRFEMLDGVVSTQMFDGGMHVILKDGSGAVTGYAKIVAAANPVTLAGDAIRQYTPMSQPQTETGQ